VENPFYDFGKHVFPALLGTLPYVRLSPDNLLWGVQYDGEWFDVGQKRDYLRVNQQVLDGKLALNLPYERFPWGYVGTDVAIDFSRVTIVPPVVIGNRCTIEPGATLGPYAVIGDDWTIARKALVRNSVLWERYPMVAENGTPVSGSQRRIMDRHEVCERVVVEDSIVASGMIAEDVRESTVEVLDDGTLLKVPIDHHPDSPRA
jgi:NDP-sugar pyrophosphorylase family protein